jgi:hypothetical protein
MNFYRTEYSYIPEDRTLRLQKGFVQDCPSSYVYKMDNERLTMKRSRNKEHATSRKVASSNPDEVIGFFN